MLPIHLTESEKKRYERTKEAEKFAKEVIVQCQQRNFTIKQFSQIVETLDFKRQLLESHAADTVKMGD